MLSMQVRCKQSTDIQSKLNLLLTPGFSVGDELGFGQSLSNVESNKRRSVQTGRGGVPSYTNTVRILKEKMIINHGALKIGFSV